MLTLTPETPIGEALSQIASGRRALFAQFHLGGCASCGFSPQETIAALCARNGEIDPQTMIDCLLNAQITEAAYLISPQEAQAALSSATPPLLIDCRTREEHDAVRLPQSLFLDETLQQSLFAASPPPAVILYDHRGQHALDTCAWFVGHGLAATQVLRGGIDAWSREIAPSLPRYQLETSSTID